MLCLLTDHHKKLRFATLLLSWTHQIFTYIKMRFKRVKLFEFEVFQDYETI